MNMHLQKIINNEKGDLLFFFLVQNPKSNRGEGEGEGPMVWISPVIGERRRRRRPATEFLERGWGAGSGDGD